MSVNIKEPEYSKPLEAKIDLLLRTGQLLIQNGADSNRIERNMRRIAEFMRVPQHSMHLHITYTTLMITIGDEINSFTKFRKCTRHGVNMTVISAVSKLSVRVIHQQFSLEEYQQELDRISHLPHHYPRWLTVLAIGLACGAFCKLFGGDWVAFGATVVASGIALFVRQEIQKRYINLYMAVAISAFVATFISGLLTFTDWSADPHYAILSSVLFLIPGVPLINSLDDMIDGYTIVGLTRAMVGLMIVCAIAFAMIITLNFLNIQQI